MDELVDLASKAHAPEVGQLDAELTAIATYVLLGELVRRTGFQPVEAYAE